MKIKRFVGGNLESNGYIISNGRDDVCYIIDPGYEPQKYIDYIQNEGLKPAGIILTHHHHDHVGGVEKIKDCFNCPVMIHYLDSFYLKSRPDLELSHGSELDMGGEKLTVLHTPGHTAGSVCILCEKSKVIFTGDTIFDTDLGRTDLSDGSYSQMVDSCKNIIDKWSNEYTIYPGHDGKATMKQVRMYNREFLDCLEAK